MSSQRNGPSLLYPLLCFALSFGCATEESPESAHWGEGLTAKQPVLSAADIGPDGMAHLAIFQSSTFAFTIKGPADGIAIGQEIDVATTPGWQVTFTAMMPGGPGLPSPGSGPDGAGVSCETVVDFSGDEKVSCAVPYVGYGEYTPTSLTVGTETDGGSALLYFHEFGSAPGDIVLVDVMYSATLIGEDGECQVFHRYTTEPLAFVMETAITEGVSANVASTVAGPTFPYNGSDDGFDVTSMAPECDIAAAPLPYRKICPLPEEAMSPEPPSGTWLWYYQCIAGITARE